MCSFTYYELGSGTLIVSGTDSKREGVETRRHVDETCDDAIRRPVDKSYPGAVVRVSDDGIAEKMCDRPRRAPETVSVDPGFNEGDG